MPIYEYECTECHEITEVWQSLSDAPATTCPECSGHLKKIISMSSFQLKGGGWYSDGYSNGNANVSGKTKNDTSSQKKNGKSCKVDHGSSSAKQTKDPSSSQTESASSKQT